MARFSIFLFSASLCLTAISWSQESPRPLDPMAQWCSDVTSAVHRFRWTIDPCSEGLNWKSETTSVEGRSLVYAEFGDPAAKNTTLVLAMVHGDEVTPLYLGIELARWLKQHPEELHQSHVIVAPLVNPDGFYRFPKTRMNSRGVDINRNFGTMDWDAHALRAWKIKFNSDPRRFPGKSAMSEPETLFQKRLIEKFRPLKIISIHAPLNHLDYDGPHVSLSRFSSEFRNKLKAVSTGYFPGSLGNYAGHEKGIPTITLELPTADPNRARQYWLTFSHGITHMIDYVLP